jgi:20S proteasome alpha/beta subunit
MTLIIAIPAKEAVIFDSDSQVTYGEVRTTGATKIRALNDRALWGASGELAIIQRVDEALSRHSQLNQPLPEIRDLLTTIVKTEVETLIKLDFRTQFLAADPNALLQLHPADFLFVEHRDSPRILHVLHNGTPEWIDGFAATGRGELFAHALLSKYAELLPLEPDIAKLLCYKTIEEAIQVGAYGLGAPIHIWEASPQGVNQQSEERIASLIDSAGVLRQREVELLEELTKGISEEAPAEPLGNTEQLEKS